MRCGDLMKKILTVLLFVLILSGCSFSLEKKDAFITIGSYSVSEEEYKIYLDQTEKAFEKVGGSDIWETDFNGKSAEDVAKDSALNSLAAVKIACSKADEYGVKTDDKMNKKAEEDANDFISANNEKYDSETVKKVMLEKQIYEKVKTAVLSDYVISDTDYKKYYDANREKFTDDETSVSVNEVYFTVDSDAENFISQLRNGTDFKTVASKLGVTDTDEINMSKTDFKQEFSSNNVDANSCGIAKDDKGYTVYCVKSVSKPDDEKITEKMCSDYKTQKENALFEQTIDEWKSDFKITKDEEKWKSISVN